ncbi:hypothetical protein CG740_14895 [Streptomyces sp. CB01201]|nr:hypothetical protein CG740_14895 [Streptomyces sp. CB01201]
MSLPWGDCDFCAGSGWGGEDTPSIFCEWCAGSGLQEFTLGDTPPLCTRAAERLAAHIDRLRALTAVAA